MKININIEGDSPEIAGAIMKLADAISGRNEAAPAAKRGRKAKEEAAEQAAENTTTAAADSDTKPPSLNKTAATAVPPPPDSVPDPSRTTQRQPDVAASANAEQRREVLTDALLARALKIVEAGKGAEVKAILNKVGAPRVKELQLQQIPAFDADLTALENAGKQIDI